MMLSNHGRTILYTVIVISATLIASFFTANFIHEALAQGNTTKTNPTNATGPGGAQSSGSTPGSSPSGSSSSSSGY
ncbi:MAG TPA: hypothetical protein VE619_05590 [Nitrososphaeraceae archaeon]|nr:hypothetical protein [Nitrososphaeraceae archaeon]